jgi:ABC-type sugar transport system ATPase subunit
VADRVSVEVSDIVKRFDGVLALDGVSVGIAGGSVHGLVGENGAGKSTLVKILAGVHRPDAGRIVVGGEDRSFRSPREALAAGIAIIAQEPVVVPARSVVENVFLGIEHGRRGYVSRRTLARRFERLCTETELEVSGDAIAGELRVADQQKVEVLRAVARRARVLIMDEPTSALTTDEAQRLFDVVHRLRAAGTTIVYVSHFLKEVLTLADDVTVLRDGRLVRTSPSVDETPASLIEAMLGRPMETAFPEKRPAPASVPVVLEVRGVTRGTRLRDVSFDVRAGEIVGLAGLVGSGRTEVARAIFGADPVDAGTVTLDGRPLSGRSPRRAIRAGIGMVPEDRKLEGVLLDRSIAENITLSHLDAVWTVGVVSGRQERSAVVDLMQRIGVRARGPRAKVGELSGGNQQKVLFARGLFKPPRLLIVDEPTRGVDVGAKRSIYRLLADVAAAGTAVLLISSEHEEVLGMAHRILVMRQGAIVAELDQHTMNEAAIVNAAFGGATSALRA